MALGRKEKHIFIGDKEYLLAFDNISIRTYKKLYGVSFMKTFHLLGEFDDETIIDFATACVREINAPDVPLGPELLNKHDLVEILLGCGDDIVQFVIEGLPKKKEKK